MILASRIRIGGSTKHHPARRLGGRTAPEILPPPSPADQPRAPARTFQIEVLYEDHDLLAISKPAGLAVHPGAGREPVTLVDLLRSKNVPLADLSDSSRAGLVHRLDKETSGILLIAKHNAAAEHLMLQFAERKILKEYRAAVRGRLPRQKMTIVGAIGRSPTDRRKFGIRHGGRDAVTEIEAIGVFPTAPPGQGVSKTGRTHQIRVQLRHAGFPILGDPVYGARAEGVERMLLHAYRIVFTHPATGARIQAIAPLPKDFVLGLIRLGFPGFD